MSKTPKFDFDHIFTQHPPTPEKIAKYEAIKQAAWAFCEVLTIRTYAFEKGRAKRSSDHFLKTIVALAPYCADRRAAEEKVHRALQAFLVSDQLAGQEIIRLIREARMDANSAIALDGRLYVEDDKTP